MPLVACVASRATGLSNHEASLQAGGETSSSTSMETRGSIEACAMSIEASTTVSAMVTAAIHARAMVATAVTAITMVTAPPPWSASTAQTKAPSAIIHLQALRAAHRITTARNSRARPYPRKP
jgi:hypothetical protein